VGGVGPSHLSFHADTALVIDQKKTVPTGFTVPLAAGRRPVLTGKRAPLN
jgi:hypothetical protein